LSFFFKKKVIKKIEKEKKKLVCHVSIIKKSISMLIDYLAKRSVIEVV